jgi:hypothetical protein
MRVIDETGQPVSGATVAIWYYIHPPAGQSEASDKIEGLTDTNGTFTASQTNTGSIDLGFQASKLGYYVTSKGHEFADFKDSDPGKWNPSVTLVLKRIARPVPMYARWVQVWPLKGDGSAGYDLMAGDWVRPIGAGTSSDITFKRIFDKRSGTDFDYTLTVAFPNNGDGIQEFSIPESDKGSALFSPHEAPAVGYISQLVRTNCAHPGEDHRADYDPSRIYFFRVHTVLDQNGNVKSALYGKIYGDPIFMNFHYYLNPSPNDRNIEFDPKQNLLQGLDALYQVSAP